MKTILFNNWKSALTVSLISIPLSLALAIASGASPSQGIVTAFWAGLIGSIFGGSHYNIIGPTGALSGVLIAFTFANGYSALPVIAIESGVFILIAYLFHLDKYIIFIPRSVIHGFTLGIAFIIGLGQLDNALGISNIQKTDHFLTSVWEVLKHAGELQWHVFLIFAISFLFIFFWNKRFKTIPGAIIIAAAGIMLVLIARWTHSDIRLEILDTKYPGIKNSLYDTELWQNPLKVFTLNAFLQKDVIYISLVTAIIAILETLLSGQIADQKTNTKFNRAREVLGLSLANIASGLAGGIPATAALARTSLNINSGADHRSSGIIHAVFVGLISIFFMQYFKLLPMVTIAAILIMVSVNMVEKKHFIKLIENEKTAFALSIIVMIIVLAEDPIIGIFAGTVLALLIFVSKLSYGQTELQIWKDGVMREVLLKDDFLKKRHIESDMIIYEITGTLTYINTPAHIAALERVKGNRYVIICLQHAFYADMDGIEYLGEIVSELKKHNEHVILTGINKEVQKQIKHEPFYKHKLDNKKIYASTTEALNDILP